MSKPAVTKLFVAAVVVIVAGLALGLAALWVALAGGVIVFGGPNVVELNGGPAAWWVGALVVSAVVAITIGSIVGVVSWIGALLNTAQLEDKTWFLVILVLGVFSLGFVAMVAYVFAGPDGTRAPEALRVTAPA